MTVAQLIEALARMPNDAVVLMESDGGLSLVSDLNFIETTEPSIPAEVILLPNMNE